MFDIGFWELVLIAIVGLVVLGPERLPTAIRGVMKFVRTAKTMANNVKAEISHELQIQEMHENLKRAEQAEMKDLADDVKQSVDQLKEAAEFVQRPYAKESDANSSLSSVEKRADSVSEHANQDNTR